MPDQSVGDTLSISDVGIVNRASLFSINDTLSLTDVIFLAVPTRQLLGDTLLLSDSVRFSTSGLGLVLSDNLSLSDLARTSTTRATPISDTVSISDTIRFGLGDASGNPNPAIYVTQGIVEWAHQYISNSLNVTQACIEIAYKPPLFPITLFSDTFTFSDAIQLANSWIGDTLAFSDNVKIALNYKSNTYLRRYLNDVIG